METIAKEKWNRGLSTKMGKGVNQKRQKGAK